MTRWMTRIVDIRNKKAAGVLSLVSQRLEEAIEKQHEGRMPTARELIKRDTILRAARLSRYRIRGIKFQLAATTLQTREIFISFPRLGFTIIKY